MCAFFGKVSSKGWNVYMHPWPRALESISFSWGTNRRCCLSRPPPEPPKLDAPPLPIEPPPPEAAVEVKDAVASEPCAVPESLAQLMGDIAEQLAEKVRTPPPHQMVSSLMPVGVVFLPPKYCVHGRIVFCLHPTQYSLCPQAVEGNGLKKRAGRHGDEPGEDHSIVASFPTCSHIKFWKRLRANRVFATLH